MGNVTIYKNNPVQRLVDTVIPRGGVANLTNPVLRRLSQIPEFGNSQCTPQMAGIKLRESFNSIPAPHLIEQVAHAKRWIKEHLISYIDGYLPTILRKVKYAHDVIKIIQYAARIVATLRFLESLLAQEVALANAWARECDLLVNFALQNLSPAGLRSQAEAETKEVLERARQDIAQQIEENLQHLECLI